MNNIDLDKKETLQGIPLFSELSIDQLRKFSSICQVVKYNKGENLFRDGDSYRGFYILLRGGIKVFRINKDGKETIIHLIRPINTFGDIPLFEGKDYPVSAEALNESVTLFVPKDKFILLIKEHHEISLKMLAGFAKRMKSLVKQIEDLSTKEVINRLAQYFLNEVKKNGTENLPEPFFRLAVPKSVIATYIGTITETFSRTLNKLQTENIIRVSGKNIFLTNPIKIKVLAGE